MLKNLLFLAIIGGVVGWYALRYDLEARKLHLAEARTINKNALDAIALKESQAAPKREETAKIRSMIDRFTELDSVKQTLNREVPVLEQTRSDVLREYKDAVEQVRTASAGLPWADITLPSGQVLTGVTIQKVTDSDVAFAHSGGVSRVNVSDLPEPLLERFRHGRPPMAIGQIPVIEPAASPAPAPVQPAAVPPPAATAPPSAKVSPKVLEMEATVRTLESKLAEYNRAQGLYQSQLQAYVAKDKELQFSGMRQKYQKEIPQIDAAIRDLNTKMAEINTRIGNLKVEIENAKANPTYSAKN